LALLRRYTLAWQGEDLSEPLQLVLDAGSPEATPKLSLIACNDRLSGKIFDLLGNLQRADSAAAEENRIGVWPVDLLC
jgi:hypothetical protein